MNDSMYEIDIYAIKKAIKRNIKRIIAISLVISLLVLIFNIYQNSKLLDTHISINTLKLSEEFEEKPVAEKDSKAQQINFYIDTIMNIPRLPEFKSMLFTKLEEAGFEEFVENNQTEEVNNIVSIQRLGSSDFINITAETQERELSNFLSSEVSKQIIEFSNRAYSSQLVNIFGVPTEQEILVENSIKEYIFNLIASFIVAMFVTTLIFIVLEILSESDGLREEELIQNDVKLLSRFSDYTEEKKHSVAKEIYYSIDPDLIQNEDRKIFVLSRKNQIKIINELNQIASVNNIDNKFEFIDIEMSMDELAEKLSNRNDAILLFDRTLKVRDMKKITKKLNLLRTNIIGATI